MAKTAGITLIVTLLLVLTMMMVARPERWPPPEMPPRQGEALALESPVGHRAVHSEEALSRLIREPQNTWSNLAFVVGGALLIAGSPRRSAQALGVALIGIGVGSFLYHASASRTLRQLDVAGMYWLFIMAVIVSTAVFFPRLKDGIEARVGIITVFSGVLAILLTAGRNMRVWGVKPFELSTTTAITATVMVLALCLTGWRRRTLRAAWQIAVVLMFFGVAVVCQLGDRPGGWLCNPDATVQAHALWHIFSAAAFVMATIILTAEGRDGKV